VLIGLGIIVLLGLVFIGSVLLLGRPAAGPATAAATATHVPIRPPQPTEQTVSSGAVSLDWAIVTQGPSPFDPNTWVARIKLSGQGGNGAYIYWVDGQRLPDASDGEFTIESQGCQAKRAEVGVTSDGQTASQPLDIQSPLSKCR
jgi:hypothetical protein